MPQQTIVAQNLKDELKNVPQKIRDWFSSEKITDLIINLNKELGLESKIEPGPKFKPASEKAGIIPLFLLRLQIKDLEPQNFTQELSSQLNVDYETAKSIAREIKKQILEPISQTLLRWEVDVNRIAVGGLLHLTEIKIPTAKETEVKPAGAKTETAPKPTEPEIKPKPFEITSLPKTLELPKAEIQPPKIEPIVIPPKPISAEQPFVIHQETQVKPATEKKSANLPSIGWFKKILPIDRQEKPKTPESPIKVELETFGQKIEESFGAAQGKEKEPFIAKTETPKQKIVHYREVETTAPFGKAQGEPFGKAPAERETSPGRQSEPFGKIQNEPFKKPEMPLKVKDVLPPPPPMSMPPKPFNAARNKPFDAIYGKPFGAVQTKPFEKPQVKPTTEEKMKITEKEDVPQKIEIELKPKIEFKPEIKASPIEIALPQKIEPLKIKPTPPFKVEVPAPVIIKEGKPAKKPTESVKPLEFETEKTFESPRPSATAVPELIDLDPFRVAKWKERDK